MADSPRTPLSDSPSESLSLYESERLAKHVRCMIQKVVRRLIVEIAGTPGRRPCEWCVWPSDVPKIQIILNYVSVFLEDYLVRNFVPIQRVGQNPVKFKMYFREQQSAELENGSRIPGVVDFELGPKIALDTWVYLHDFGILPILPPGMLLRNDFMDHFKGVIWL